MLLIKTAISEMAGNTLSVLICGFVAFSVAHPNCRTPTVAGFFQLSELKIGVIVYKIISTLEFYVLPLLYTSVAQMRD